MIRVHGPAFQQELERQAGETFAALAQRAAQANGGRLPSKPVFIADGAQVEGNVAVPETLERLTVAGNAANG